ncbi:hypothetical protein H8356DRAFT_1294676 [Neocallimastix lanati (nom. inval.)]|nr:hypothetical protein H8356DRAFT_1294676 [Neocallimastix sp. JGI-2020a]
MIPTYIASINDNATVHFKLQSNYNKIIESLYSYNPYNFALNTSKVSVNKFSNTSEIDRIMSKIKNELGSINRNNEVERSNWGKCYISKAKFIGVPCIL